MGIAVNSLQSGWDLANSYIHLLFCPQTMAKRTPQSKLDDLDDTQRLDEIVSDKRQSKRAGRAKARRRNRRYENRLLRVTLEQIDDEEM